MKEKRQCLAPLAAAWRTATMNHRPVGILFFGACCMFRGAQSNYQGASCFRQGAESRGFGSGDLLQLTLSHCQKPRLVALRYRLAGAVPRTMWNAWND